MARKVSENRRNFLKTSAVGAAGLMIGLPLLKKVQSAPLTTTLVNLSTTPINTDIDNLRVAYITDPGMVLNSSVANTPYPGWDSFNNPTNATTGVNYSAVQTNMDKMACALANKTDATTAWATIFKIPASKPWGSAKAALKVNAFANDHPSVPIVAKICRVLVALGMPAGNITIYDAHATPAMYNNATYVGANSQLIPTGVVFSSDGFPNQIVMPASAGGETISITKAVDGVDIIVSIACNKGHDQVSEYSGVTMSQKNHKGTMFFGCNDADVTNGIQRLVNANSCDYIAGNIPAAYPARQQLCIVDSLWCSRDQEWQGDIDSGMNANSIVMGTFAGAVDYVGTMKVRISKYAASTWNQTIVDQFITGYGYPASAKTTVMTAVAPNVAGPGLVNAASTVSTLPDKDPNRSRQKSVQFTLSGNGARNANTNLYLGNGETVQSAEIYNTRGQRVRALQLRSGTNQIVWDGRTDSGNLATPGNYVVRIKGQKSVASGDVALSR